MELELELEMDGGERGGRLRVEEGGCELEEGEEGVVRCCWR